MKNAVMFVLFASLLLIGCGTTGGPKAPPVSSSSAGPVQPPQATVTIGGQQIPTVVNGYQWSSHNQTAIADAASDPAKSLKKYNATVGEKVTLSFAEHPKAIQLTMWSNGEKVSSAALSNPAFSLPSHPGDYIYEFTGHWGNDYVNYDFEVQVR